VVHWTTDELQSAALKNAGITYPIRASMPLARLGPGRYVLEVALAPYVEPDAAVTRNIPFEVR
jgi:hypothetical protein